MPLCQCFTAMGVMGTLASGGILAPWKTTAPWVGYIMRLGAALVGAAAAIALATPANAARLTSWYGVFEGGGNALEDMDVERFVTPAPVPVDDTLDTDIGWVGLAALGYAFSDSGWRTEFEGGYRHNELNRIINAAGVASPAAGDFNQYSAMMNFLYDFTTPGRLSLTVGGGVGAVYADMDATSLGVPTPIVQDGDVSLAFQAIAGLNYQMASWLDLVLNYRYLYVTDVKLADETIVAPSTAHVEADKLTQHTLTMGFRFGSHAEEAAAAPVTSAPPPLPPQIARQYVIYFGFNKCNITADADQVLGEAATAAHELGTVAIRIVGHTDTVGSQRANQRLSECRANAAKSNLVGRGIPAGSILATGAGETQLVVQTGDGIKEPQNRRATIDLN